MPKRCALGCQPKPGCVLHIFPNLKRFPDRFKEWVQIVGGKLETESDYKKYQSSVICDVHFTDNVRNRYNRLNALAVPTLHLKGWKHDTSSDEFNKTKSTLDPSPTSNSSPAGESDNENTTQIFKSEPILDSSSTSDHYITDCETSTKVAEPEPILNLLSTVDHCMTGLSNHETTTQTYKPEDSRKASTLSKTNLNLPPVISREPILDRCPTALLKEHNYSVQEKPDATKTSDHRPVVPPHIVHQLQTVRKKVKQLQNEVWRLRKRNAIIKKRLINAKNNNKHNCFEKIAQNMTAVAKVFTHMQFTQTHKKNSGRRFTPEEQELSLSIFRNSPQCYNFLSEMFTFPSVKTLKKIIKANADRDGMARDFNCLPINIETYSCRNTT